MTEPGQDIAEARAAFFARTRRATAFLYVAAAAAAVAMGILAITADPLLAAVAILGGAVVTLGLFTIGTILPVPAKVSRWLVIGSGLSAVVLTWIVDLLGALPQAASLRFGRRDALAWSGTSPQRANSTSSL